MRILLLIMLIITSLSSIGAIHGFKSEETRDEVRYTWIHLYGCVMTINRLKLEKVPLDKELCLELKKTNKL